MELRRPGDGGTGARGVAGGDGGASNAAGVGSGGGPVASVHGERRELGWPRPRRYDILVDSMTQRNDNVVRGRYEVLDEIASGGMASVYIGRLIGPVGFARTVAIKRLHDHLAKDPEFVTMFVDEARLAARVVHSNVVPTLDIVASDGELLLVMEYVHGETLSRLLRQAPLGEQRLSTPIVSSIVTGVLHGLHAAHEAKDELGRALSVVHRDVSPQNILVGVDGIARVLDFGVAKAAGQLHFTREGQLRGKLGYMAPEQLVGLPVSRASDVYAVGVVLWEVLSGARLFDVFEGDSSVAARVKKDATVPRLRPRAPHVSEELEQVVMRALAREPETRWGSAREMALALERCAPLAPPSEVGEWVEAAAREGLARRAAFVASVGNGSAPRAAGSASVEASGTDPTYAPNRPAQNEPENGSAHRAVPDMSFAREARPVKTRRLPRVVAAVGAVGVASIGLLSWRLGASPAPESVGSAEHAEAPSSPSLAPVLALGAASTMSLATASPELPMPASAGASSRSVAPVVTTLRPRRAAVECDPPYVEDARGHRHFKAECF